MSATAAGTASIKHIGMRIYPSKPVPTVDLIERYRRWCTRVRPHVSDNRLETALYAPSPIEPSWMENKLTAIRKSVAPSPQAAIGDGRWLSQNVVNAATDFFRLAGDVLPGEPFIYSSREGDLVAEFEGKHGTMTSIVSSTFVLLFAVIDGVPVERTIFETRGIREEVQQLTRSLLAGRDGHLETAR